jgi:hypothetical protein
MVIPLYHYTNRPVTPVPVGHIRNRTFGKEERDKKNTDCRLDVIYTPLLRILQIKNSILMPIIFLFCILGTYAIHGRFSDIIVMVIFAFPKESDICCVRYRSFFTLFGSIKSLKAALRTAFKPVVLLLGPLKGRKKGDFSTAYCRNTA